jgi:hypothetical protein
MRSRLRWICVISSLVALAQAQDPRDRASGAAGSTATNPGAAGRRGAPARGPLPDPALLDGSTQAAEKKQEYGMLGEFEIPGDANSKSDKVGGQPQQQGGGGGQQNPNQAQQQQGGGASGMPPMGMPQGAAAGGAGGQQMPPGAQPGGGGLPGGKPVDPSQANGQGGGTQVAELKTDEANAGGVGGGEPNAPKPKQVSIGDPAMQIKGVQNAPGIVGGAVPAGPTQQMEKAVGGAGKGTSGDNTNKGIEKGRVVPAGL